MNPRFLTSPMCIVSPPSNVSVLPLRELRGASVPNTQVHHSHTPQTLARFRNPSISGSPDTLSPFLSKPASSNQENHICVRSCSSPSAVKSVATFDDNPTITVKAVVTVKVTSEIQDTENLRETSILLELVSAEVDPRTGIEKERIKEKAYYKTSQHVCWLRQHFSWLSQHEDEVKYECVFVVGEDFGEIGGVLVENEHDKGMYLKSITLEGLINGTANVNCNSWVAPKSANQKKRVFFTDKSYLPSQTPKGLRRLRQKELGEIQGDGKAERKTWDRIYDYDVYNDLGKPDESESLRRPVLGGEEHPYPRRCRTGRKMSEKDSKSETRSKNIYVPRDEVFSDVKRGAFKESELFSLLRSLKPDLEGAIEDADKGFPDFEAIDSLFNIEGLPNKNGGSRDILPRIVKGVFDAAEHLLRFEPPPMFEYSLFNIGGFSKDGESRDILPRIVEGVFDASQHVLRFEPPPMFKKDKSFWLMDGEFARETLAGLNPCSIQLVTEWPLKSKLDPNIYGSPESAITKEIIECEIGVMTLEEARTQKKLFMLDYHDLLLPYVKKVRAIKEKTLYGSRTLFILKSDGTLRPLAIELTRPPMDDKPQWKQVFTPTHNDARGCWLWRLAKSHVRAHDSGHHQLVSHWLRSHCATEPYIIATNRQLSVIHPIYKLLHPHFRYTMEINAFARKALINADGVIETTFSPDKYSMEISSAAYDLRWRFDHQALPADLISRGMAEENPTAPHGLKLTIEDYPFANDGLILWDAIKQWVTDYVEHYYPNSNLVESDNELQAWWTEIRTVGHGDKKEKPGWPELKTAENLIQILTTIIWVASGHHSAVNFGQYGYAGYFPNRPTIARTKMPTEDPNPKELKLFQTNPEKVFLQCLPTQIQATKIIGVLKVLSSHSPDEEYIGGNIEGAWAENPKIKDAFDRFQGKLKELEREIDRRNSDKDLRNRSGVGVVYELLKPYSKPGVTGKGVPNSISI